MNRFVRPETAVLTLANGDTLVVKQRLNTGEWRRMTDTIRQAGDERGATVLQYQTGLVLAYLVDWSLTDDGRPVVIRDQPIDTVRASLDALDYESFREIADAIQVHTRRQDEARAAEKKTPNTANESPAILPSPFVAVGVTNG
jgi:hypothetical protein